MVYEGGRGGISGGEKEVGVFLLGEGIVKVGKRMEEWMILAGKDRLLCRRSKGI